MENLANEHLQGRDLREGEGLLGAGPSPVVCPASPCPRACGDALLAPAEPSPSPWCSSSVPIQCKLPLSQK